MGAEEVMNYVLEELKELLLVLQNWGGQLIGWVDKVFPPESRAEQLNHWLKVAAPFALASMVLLICICCCRNYCCCCCRQCLGCCRHCLRCCCRCFRGLRVTGRMMVAPGRRPIMMLRSAFESNPAAYFQNLRANPPPRLLS